MRRYMRERGINMKIRIVAFVAVATLTGCQTNSMPPPPATAKYSLNDAERAAVEKGVRASLKDPASAMFGGMIASDAGGGVKYVCGLVNAKNSFGGYTGNTSYLGVLGSMQASGKTLATFSVTSMGTDDGKAATVSKLCHHYGVM